MTLLRGCPQLHHLFFEDDSLFFIQVTVENARALKAIIMDYCRPSAQNIKTKKSILTFNHGPDGSMVATIVDELNIPDSNNTGKYLGLPSFWRL